MLSADLSHACRSLARTPWISCAALVCLASAIAAATAVFTIVDGVVLRALPFSNAARLLAIWGADPSRDNVLRGFSWLDAHDLASDRRGLEDLAVMENVNGGITLTGRGEPVQLPARTVSGNFFEVLGVRAALGRTLDGTDDRAGSPPAVMLSDAIWRQRFGGDPAIVGAALTLDSRVFIVAGVAPRDFAYPPGAQLWMTVAHASPELLNDRSVGWLEVIGLARAGLTAEAVRADLGPAFQRITTTFHPARGREQLMVTSLQRELLGEAGPALWAMFAGVLVLLAVACANVGGLLLVRAAARAHDVAVRLALGAGRGDVFRRALAESLVLAVASGVMGVGLSLMLVDITRRLGPADIPGLATIGVDLRVMFFAVAVVATTTLVCAVVPAVQASGTNVLRLLQHGGRGITGDRAWLRRVLAASELALSVILIVAAGMVGRTFLRLRSVNVGFTADRILAFDVPLPATRYPKPEHNRQFNDRLLPRLSTLPGVRHAAAVLLRPLWSTVGLDWPVVIDGQAPADAARNPLTNLEAISPGYFQTLGIPLIAGRDLSADDRDGRPPVAIVGASFARRFWSDSAALGRRIQCPLPGSPYDRQWFTVVGIVGDARYRGLREHRLDLYISAAQSPYSAHQFVVRADGNPAALTGAIRAEVRAIDPDLPIDDVVVLSDAVARQLANPRFTAVVFVAFATTAAGLAALGLGTLMSWLVRQRTSEIGLRVALGATPGQVTRLVMADGAQIIAPGVAAGIAVAALMTTLLRSLLFEISPHDPVAITGAAALAIGVGLLSSYGPARRAGRVDPLRRHAGAIKLR